MQLNKLHSPSKSFISCLCDLSSLNLEVKENEKISNLIMCIVLESIALKIGRTLGNLR